MNKKQKAYKIMELLKEEFPDVTTPLTHSNDYELLFAVIMSAQMTDEGVNGVTQKLYKKYKNLDDFAYANVEELMKDMNSINYYKSKARNIHKTANILIDQFDRKVPDNMQDLLKLAGVGRKTANVILSEWFGINVGFVVDTHVRRAALRTGLTKHKNVVRIEKDLMKLYPQSEWNEMSLRFIFHGRTTCPARRKSSERCSLGELCKVLE